MRALRRLRESLLRNSILLPILDTRPGCDTSISSNDICDTVMTQHVRPLARVKQLLER